MAVFDIVVDNKDAPDEPAIYEESYICRNEIDAGNRLGDLWNEHCAKVNRGYRARLWERGNPTPYQTIT